MKYFLIFVLFLNGCSDEHGLKTICSPFSMTISDAIPIQFWVNGVETYNQKEVCGITPACFCQPFNCDDEIRIQISGEDLEYSLLILDSSGTTITTLLFTEISPDVWELSFVPRELSICDENIRLEIISEDVVSDFSRWDAVAIPIDGGVPWTNGNTTHTLTDLTPASSQYLVRPFYWQAGVTYTFTYQITLVVSGIGYDSNIFSICEDNETTGVCTHSDQDQYNSSGVKNGTFTITPTSTYFGYVRISNLIQILGSPASCQLTLNSISVSTSGAYTHASSDCIDIRESHDCSVLIRYDNSKDFADIEYSDFSPTAEFYLRISAVFFHEQNTEEQERFETSGETIVRLRDEVKVKRLLETGYMPDYMHRKLLLILAHDTIEIDSETWVRTDPYEKIPPANKRYPLKRAQVLLTQQGYIKRNIL